MADDDVGLSESIQESIVTAIALCDDDTSKVIANLINSTLFDHPLDEIVLKCLNHRKEFGTPPGSSHIDDLFSDIMEDTKHKEHTLYQRIITNMIRQKEGIDTQFILSEVSKFIQKKKWRAGIEKSITRYTKGGPGLITDLETITRDNLRIIEEKPNYGSNLIDKEALGFFDKEERNYCLLGIPEFDDHNIHPEKGTLTVFLASRGRGKSMFLNLCGKQGILQGWKVMHYTLENSAEMTCQRYFQSLFSGVKRHGLDYATYFEGEEDEPKLVTRQITPNFVIEDRDVAREYLLKEKQHWNWKTKLANIRIKQYPTGRMSFSDLEKDLDDLALVKKFVPDMILLDYPQICKMERRNQKYEELDDLIVSLRGLAVDCNIAMVCPQQGNRASENATTVQGYMGGGTMGILATADTAITYSQTEWEREHQIARLYSQKVRNDLSGFSVYISQSYSTAQFLIDSSKVTRKLRDAVKTHTGAAEDQNDDDDEFEEAKRVKRK